MHQRRRDYFWIDSQGELPGKKVLIKNGESLAKSMAGTSIQGSKELQAKLLGQGCRVHLGVAVGDGDEAGKEVRSPLSA